MSVRMTFGIQRVWGDHPEHDPVTLYDDTDGMAFGPIFTGPQKNEEADAFIAWFAEQGVGELSSATADKHMTDVWRRVWASMAANRDHEHNPGCSYQGRCSCGWTSGWGDSDNAFHTSWDHAHESKGKHQTTSAHR